MTDETGILWAFGLVSAAIFAWLGKITHMLTGLSERYVPRTQIDARFLQMQKQYQQQILDEKTDRKEDMKEIKAQLTTIIDKLDSKADK